MLLNHAQATRAQFERSMKLAIFGLSVSSAWGNGHATLWRGLWRALARRGHEVVFFERDMPWYAAHRDLGELPGGRLVLYPSWEEVRSVAARELGDADAAIVTSYCPDGRDAAALVLGSAVPVRAFYDLDTPVTLERLRRGEPVDYLPPDGLGDFDVVLSYTGGAALDELVQRLGARRVAPLYGSVDPERHRPSHPAAAYLSDLSYLGTYASDRQHALVRLFVEPARQRPSRRFVIGGAQYPGAFPWTSNIHFVYHVPPDHHPAFYCSSRLTLNVTRGAMAALGWCPSGRLFEAAACGVPILSDWWEGLDDFFAPGDEVLLARDTSEALSALDADDAELARVGRAARARVLDCHTADHRARELESALASGGAPG
jgi:spore maturation protein CgeB